MLPLFKFVWNEHEVHTAILSGLREFDVKLLHDPNCGGSRRCALHLTCTTFLEIQIWRDGSPHSGFELEDDDNHETFAQRMPYQAYSDRTYGRCKSA